MTLHELRYALPALLGALSLGVALGVPLGRASAAQAPTRLDAALWPVTIVQPARRAI